MIVRSAASTDLKNEIQSKTVGEIAAALKDIEVSFQEQARENKHTHTHNSLVKLTRRFDKACTAKDS